MELRSTVSDAAAGAGVGALAGVAGTAAMTTSSTAEAKLRGRGSNDSPATEAGSVLGVEPIRPSQICGSEVPAIGNSIVSFIASDPAR